MSDIDEESDDGKNDKPEVTQSLFVCNRWLAKGEDDNQIVRELVPTDEQGKVLKRNALQGKRSPDNLTFLVSFFTR